MKKILFILLAIMTSASQARADLLSYGQAFMFFPFSESANRPYMRIESRMLLTGAHGNREYQMLARHPRETTFADDGGIYSTMLSLESGASFITFMMDPATSEMVIARRYDSPGQPPQYLQQCGTNPYTGGVGYEAKKISSLDLREIFGFQELFAAASSQNKIIATVEYNVSGVSVYVEFPVDVININPDDNALEGKKWQIASSQIPFFHPGSDYCHSIKTGYVAFGRLGANKTASFVYLCEVSSPRETQDFSCSQNYTSTIRVFEVIE